MGESVSTIQTGSRQRTSERLGGGTDMNSRAFKSAVTRASRQTASNYHGEARKTLAKAFGYKDLADGYTQINKEHNAMGYLGGDLRERRDRLDNEMEKRVRRDYGETGVRNYNKGLS